ncbi:MAG: NAD-binding protein [Planctomycetaceae bacterium]
MWPQISEIFKQLPNIRFWCLSYLMRRIAWVWRQWFAIAVLLISLTVVFTWVGLSKLNDSRFSTPQTEFYHALKTLVMSSPAVESDEKPLNWCLELGRWLGATFFFGGVASIVAKLFSQPALSLSTWLFARNHVVLTGLGRPEENHEEFVIKLLNQWKSVIIIEPDANHPAIEACTKAGAIVLIGSPYEQAMLKRARIKRAERIVLISGNDRENVGLAYLVYHMLQCHGEQTAVVEKIEHPFRQREPNQVNCLLGVTEPGLVEAIRHDSLYTNSKDRLRLSVFCLREMVARAMLRETRLLDSPRPLGNLLVIGLGKELRMGESLITRAAKDWYIDQNDILVTTSVRLVIDVIDEHADAFVDCMTKRVNYLKEHDSTTYPTENDACFLRSFPWRAARCGFRSDEMKAMLIENKYDAIFICLADEGMAVRQGLELRRLLDSIPGNENVSVVVRVLEENSGFGPLLHRNELGVATCSKGNANLVAVGFRDRVQEVLLSMNPEIEMLAQVIHQQYLLTTDKQLRDAILAGNQQQADTLRAKEARCSWNDLDEVYRQSNRDQATRLADYVEHNTTPKQSRPTYDLLYAPHLALSPRLGTDLDEWQLKQLAMDEHNNWMTSMKAAGWKLDRSIQGSDPTHKLSPFLVPWEELDDRTRQYDIDIVNRLAITFAKADYRLERKD